MINSPPKLRASNSRLESEWSLKSPSGNHRRQAGKTAALRNTDELSMEDGGFGAREGANV